MDSPGFTTTHRACMGWGRVCYAVADGETRPSDVAQWLGINGFKVLKVAGNSESIQPGIGDEVERFLLTVFRQLRR